MMGMTPGPLVHTLLPIFFAFLQILLVVLVSWGLAFLYQQKSSPNVIFFRLLCVVLIGVKSKGGRLIRMFWRSNSLLYLQI